MHAQYRLTGRLEGGELAELFRAQRFPGEPVVLKLFHPRTSDSAYARELREVTRNLLSVSHPGVLAPLELGMVRGRLAVVRADVGGFNLGQVLRRLSTREVHLPPPVALLLVRELLEVLEHAHRAGVLHGAITPGNVLLSKEGRPALCDFGVLRALQAVPHLRQVFGSYGRGAYRAPELAKGEQATVESDVYSLGALAYELLTLREPSAGNGPALSVRREPLPPPSRFDRRLNARVDAVIMRAIELVPARRFGSCGQMSAAIDEFFASTGGPPDRGALLRLVEELLPNEVRIAEASDDVPFEEIFALADAQALPTGEIERIGEPGERPSFSLGQTPLDEDPHSTEDEIPAAALLPSWDAPPGASPPERKPAPGRAPGVDAARLRRLRPLAEFDASATVENPIPPVHTARPTQRTEGWSYAAEPAGDLGPIAVASRSELNLIGNRAFRQRALLGVLGVALAGVVILALSLWRTEPIAPVAVPSEVKKIVRRSVPAAVRPAPTRAAEPVARPTASPKGVEPAVDWHVPAKVSAGFLSVSANVPAVLYVDGQRVRRPLPLNRYPVASGKRRLAIVGVRTGERKEFQLRVAKGQHLKLLEQLGTR